MDSSDPTFGMIESHRQALAAYRAALGRLAPLRPGPELDAANAVASRASDVLGLVSTELVELQPTTVQGLDAWTRYVDECNRGDADECLLPYFDSDNDPASSN